MATERDKGPPFYSAITWDVKGEDREVRAGGLYDGTLLTALTRSFVSITTKVTLPPTHLAGLQLLQGSLNRSPRLRSQGYPHGMQLSLIVRGCNAPLNKLKGIGSSGHGVGQCASAVRLTRRAGRYN